MLFAEKNKSRESIQELKAEKRFFVITVSFVLFLGFFSFYSLISVPSAKPISYSKIISQGKTNEAGVRAPASEVSPVLHRVDSIGTQLLQIDCRNPLKQKEAIGRHLRLKGVHCEGISQINITNETNGFNASVIQSNDKKSFSTDFLDLKDGINKIKITWAEPSGKKNFDLEINSRKFDSF